MHVADPLTGMTLPLPFGWVGHFFLGTVAWGIIYAVLRASSPGTPVVKGLIFAAVAWLAMMMAAMRALERAPRKNPRWMTHLPRMHGARVLSARKNGGPHHDCAPCSYAVMIWRAAHVVNAG